MAASIETLITDDMRACIGKKSPVWSLPEEISASDVRRYVEATGDNNPLWLDDDFARGVGYRGRRVPPLFVQQMRWRIDSREPGESDSWSGLKFPPGYTSTRNAGQEVEWLAPVYIGDSLTFQTELTEIFVKEGRSGPIIFTKHLTEVRNQDGLLVMRTTSTSAKLHAARVDENSAESSND
ncbi:MAG TPA: MaoC family dehydratase [Chloroflexota bacterium]|jgi:3-methylfumaryl-CoA hydratase